eukprot:gene7938-biopygen9118
MRGTSAAPLPSSGCPRQWHLPMVVGPPTLLARGAVRGTQSFPATSNFSHCARTRWSRRPWARLRMCCHRPDTIIQGLSVERQWEEKGCQLRTQGISELAHAGVQSASDQPRNGWHQPDRSHKKNPVDQPPISLIEKLIGPVPNQPPISLGMGDISLIGTTRKHGRSVPNQPPISLGMGDISLIGTTRKHVRS